MSLSLRALAPLVVALIAGCGDTEPPAPPSVGDPAAEPAAAREPAVAEAAAPSRESEAAQAETTPPAAPPTAAPTATATATSGTVTAARAATAADAPAKPSKPSKPAATPSPNGTAMAPMPGTVTRQTELKAEPAPGARTLSTLAASTAVTITARQGGWLLVTSGGAKGWVRLLHVSSQPAARGSGAREELEAAARVATGRAGTGNVAVTTGIRGLDEEQLRDAKPDTEELERLESLGAQSSDAQTHAQRRGLERRQVPYPPPAQARS